MKLRLLARPEVGAAAAALALWLFFALAAGPRFRSLEGAQAVLNAAAPLGILTIAVGLLMIAGEFDLSVGSIIGAAGMSVMLLTQQFGWSVWPAIAATFVLCLLIGLANGVLVVRTALPSFIVTLATLFILRGLTIAVPRLLTRRTQLGGLERSNGFDSAHAVFAANLGGLDLSVFWWLLLAGLASWVLLRTPFGNWIYGTGGGADAARRAGVPIDRVRIGLFLSSACTAGFIGIMQAVQYTGSDALRGEQQEFRAIVAGVIGGTLLTGGYGSALGALVGALIFGMLQQGIVIMGVDADWFQVLLGAMLLAAVLVNNRVRRAVTERA